MVAALVVVIVQLGIISSGQTVISRKLAGDLPHLFEIKECIHDIWLMSKIIANNTDPPDDSTPWVYDGSVDDI